MPGLRKGGPIQALQNAQDTPGFGGTVEAGTVRAGDGDEPTSVGFLRIRGKLFYPENRTEMPERKGTQTPFG